MKRALIFIMVCAIMTVGADGGKTIEEEAITLSGRRVLLYQDGTWAAKQSSEEKEIRFRGLPWGTSLEAAKGQFEKEPTLADDAHLIYEETLATLDAGCYLIFVEDRFVRGGYRFTQRHSNKNDYLADFARVDQALRGKYGEPPEHDILWRNDLYRDDPESLGMAVAIGHLSRWSSWTTGSVTITHGISGDNFEILHVVEYTHKNMSDLESAVRMEEDQAKL